MFVRKFQCAAIAARQTFRLALATAVPDRTDRMNDKPGRQMIPLSDFCITGTASTKRFTFRQQFRPGSPVNGAVHATAAQQASIGSIDDCIYVQRCDVRPNRFHEKKIHDGGRKEQSNSFIPLLTAIKQTAHIERVINNTTTYCAFFCLRQSSFCENKYDFVDYVSDK